MAGICRPLSPLNLAGFSNQQLPTYAEALPRFVKFPSVASLPNWLANIFQHNGLDHI
jgi:hypothetical protein